MGDSLSAEPTGRHVKRKHGLTRSKTGCLTCRKRRKKCNTGPDVSSCGHCARLGLTCEWPDASTTPTRSVKTRQKRSKSKDLNTANNTSAGASHTNVYTTNRSSIFDPVEIDPIADRDAEVQQAAATLLNHKEIADMAAVSPLANFQITYPYNESTPPSNMIPTQEDLEAAQWLSSYRADNGTQQYEKHSPALDKFNTKIDLPASNFEFLLYNVNEYIPDIQTETRQENGDAVHYASSPEEERRFFVPTSPFEHVDHNTRILLDYFETEFARLISVVPTSSNDLLRVFLPMAVENGGVRDAIAGWSATHLRDIDDKFTAQSHLYLTRAASWLELAMLDPIEQDRDSTLAVALIICAVEVCKDVDSRWTKYRTIAHQIITRRALIHSYKGHDQVFLLMNFAYHDVMSSFEPDPKSLPDQESQEILSTIPDSDTPDTYMGICIGLYRILAEVSTLAQKSRFNRWPDRTLSIHASRLIVSLDGLQIPTHLLVDMPVADQMKHTSMFKILQLTAKLYIHQTLLKYPATTPATQLLIGQIMPFFSNLQTVLVEMLFPLFITGVDSLTAYRPKIKRMMEIMFERFRIGNVRCAYEVLERVWERDGEGGLWIDWNTIAHDLFGARISFA